MNINTPVGKIPIRQSIIEKTNNMRKKDLFKKVEQTGFVDPELLEIVKKRGLYFEYIKWQKEED